MTGQPMELRPTGADLHPYVQRHVIENALWRAAMPHFGQFVLVSIREGKGDHWASHGAILLSYHSGGLLIQGPRYRTWINAIDLWTGEARCLGDLGEAIDSAFVRLRTGEDSFAAIRA